MTGGATSSSINRPAPDPVEEMKFWERERRRRARHLKNNPPGKLENLKKKMGNKMGNIFNHGGGDKRVEEMRRWGWVNGG
jgi:hypothetical protein